MPCYWVHACVSCPSVAPLLLVPIKIHSKNEFSLQWEGDINPNTLLIPNLWNIYFQKQVMTNYVTMLIPREMMHQCNVDTFENYITMLIPRQIMQQCIVDTCVNNVPILIFEWIIQQCWYLGKWCKLCTDIDTQANDAPILITLPMMHHNLNQNKHQLELLN